MEMQQLFTRIRKPGEVNSEDELMGGEGNLKFDDILGGMGIQDIISGSDSEEESKKGPTKFVWTTKAMDVK